MATDTGLPQIDLKKYDKVVLGLISGALILGGAAALGLLLDYFMGVGRRAATGAWSEAT